ncbi:hypothetical protein BJX99DRAFT_266755 [Aspergillus californicus]
MAMQSHQQPAHSNTSSCLKGYVHPPETACKIDFARLTILDMSIYDLPGGKEKLAELVKTAAHNDGFFYITNFGLSREQVDRQFAIADRFFNMPSEAKIKFRASLEEGESNGYRPSGTYEVAPGLRDNLEYYNIFKFIPQCRRPQPEVIQQYIVEIEAFHRHVHQGVVYKLLRLLAIALEIPEDELVNGHRYEAICDSALRYAVNRARSEEENSQLNDIYLSSHTDNGTLTIVFQQPVAALQAKCSDECGWQWVRIPPGFAAVNIADSLQVISGGYFKSGLHRVVAPPQDQSQIDRLGLFYFVRPSNELRLRTVNSPLMQRLGIGDGGIDMPAAEWVKSRVRNYSAQSIHGTSG